MKKKIIVIIIAIILGVIFFIDSTITNENDIIIRADIISILNDGESCSIFTSPPYTHSVILGRLKLACTGKYITSSELMRDSVGGTCRVYYCIDKTARCPDRKEAEDCIFAIEERQSGIFDCAQYWDGVEKCTCDPGKKRVDDEVIIYVDEEISYPIYYCK